MKTMLAIFLSLALLVSCVPAYAQTRQTAWDLTDLYADDAAVEDAIAEIEGMVAQIPSYRGTLKTVDGVLAWYRFNNEYATAMGRLSCYASLLTGLNAGDGAARTLSGRIDNLAYDASAASAFMIPELFSQSKEFLDDVEWDERMAIYRLEFQRSRRDSEHMLSEEQEKLLLPLNRLIDGACSLYDSLSYLELPYADIEFPDGVTRPADENNYSLALYGGFEQSFRKAFSDAMMESENAFRNTIAQNFHNYCTGVSEKARAHGYASALEADLLYEDVEPALYQAVIDASLRGEEMVGRYIELMKRELGLDVIYSFDTNLPIADIPSDVYTYDEACELVLSALAPLGEKYVLDAREALSGGWVDVYSAEGKQTGAYSMGIPGAHPYMLLNFDGTFTSVSTLAHELGHTMHQWYSAQAQPTAYASNPVTVVSEVASTLNELLLTDYMVKNAQTDGEREYYIANELSTLYNTFFTQALFARFQQVSMEALESGEALTADRLDELWVENSDLYDGCGTIQHTNGQKGGWSRVSHFYQGFYTYQYALAISASCAIAQRISAGEEGAVDSYLTYLSAGDTGSVAEMLAIAGVEATNDDFIDGLLTRFETLMKEFEDA